MTTASSSAAAGGHGRLFHLAMLLGHYSRRTSPVVTILVWALIILGWWAPDYNKSLLGAAFYFTVLGLLVADITGLFCRIFVHDRNLCLRDLQESPLLDPQSAVDKNIRALRTCHSRRFHKTLLGISFAPIVVLLAVAGIKEMPLLVKVALTVMAAAGITTTIYVGHIQNVHSRLQPWCPFCRRDDGPDDPVVEPTPDPVSSAQR